MKKILGTLSILTFLLLSSLFSSALQTQEAISYSPLTTSDQYENGYRYNIQGWIYLHIEGDPYERGFQHGYLLSAEIVDMLNRWSNTIHNHGMLALISPRLSEERYNKISQRWWTFCITMCMNWYGDKFPEEYQLEMQGIADGVTSNGGQIHGRDVTYGDILALNEMYEFLSKLERIPKGIHPLRTFLQLLQTSAPELTTLDEDKFIESFLDQTPTHHCSGFVATGDATTHGQIVITDSMWCGGGSWWWTYYIALRWNIILDINPTEGHRLLMASSPGYIWSNHDYYQNDAGLVLIETTVPQGLFDMIGLPLAVRARTVLQYGESIDDVIYFLSHRNDGAMNSVWLIGDTKTGEIARFELGYRHYAVQRTFNGFYWSANNPENTMVRLEKVEWKRLVKKFVSHLLFGTSGFGYHSIIYRPESRDIKFEELGNLYYGGIDVDVVKEIMSTSPIGDYSTDCKLTDSYLVAQNGMWAFCGNCEGKFFNLTDIDTPTRKVEQIHPTGWLRIFCIPGKENFTLLTQKNDSAEQADMLWEYDTGYNRNDFVAFSTIHNDTLYAVTSIGMLYALNVENGTLHWCHPVGEHPTAPVVHDNAVFIGHATGLSVVDPDGTSGWWIAGSNITADPVIGNGMVFFGGKTGNVYAYSLDTREQQWQLELPDRDEVHLSAYDADHNCIYVTAGTNCSAVNATSADIVWSFETNGMITAAPLVFDNVVYVGSWDTYVYVLNASTGDLLWSYETGWGIDTTPAILEDTIFVGAQDNNCYALNRHNGSLDWVFTCNAGIHSSPVILEDLVFFGSDDGRLYALHTATGNPQWIFAPGFTIDDDVYNYITTPHLSKPAVDNGVVYTGANGFLYALNAQID